MLFHPGTPTPSDFSLSVSQVTLKPPGAPALQGLHGGQSTSPGKRETLTLGLYLPYTSSVAQLATYSESQYL